MILCVVLWRHHMGPPSRRRQRVLSPAVSNIRLIFNCFAWRYVLSMQTYFEDYMREARAHQHYCFPRISLLDWLRMFQATSNVQSSPAFSSQAWLPDEHPGLSQKPTSAVTSVRSWSMRAGHWAAQLPILPWQKQRTHGPWDKLVFHLLKLG